MSNNVINFTVNINGNAVPVSSDYGMKNVGKENHSTLRAGGGTEAAMLCVALFVIGFAEKFHNFFI